MSGVVVGGGHMSSHMIRVILPTLCLQQWQQSAAHCYVTCECSDSWIDNIQPVLYCTELTTHTTLSVLSFNIIIVPSKTKLVLKWPSVISDSGFQVQSWYLLGHLFYIYNMKTVLVVINVYTRIMTNAFLTATDHGYRLWGFGSFIRPLITLLYLALNKIVHLKIFNLTYFKSGRCFRG